MTKEEKLKYRTQCAKNAIKEYRYRQALSQEQKYCDRNICLRNEYNGIGCDECEVTKSQEPCKDCISRQQARSEYADWYGYGYQDNWFYKRLGSMPSVAIPNKTEPKQALYEIRETIDDWWDKRIITNHTVYKMLRKLVEEKMYRD